MKKIKIILIVIIVLLPLLYGLQGTTNFLSNNQNVELDDILEPELSSFWNLTPILIDDDGGTLGSRTWAEIESSEEWCNGLGTWDEPYIIENVTIYANNNDSAIRILDSNVYFILHNNTLTNSGSGTYSGISVNNATNGQLIDNNATNNNGIGIYLTNTDNFTIFGNTVTNNAKDGISLLNSHNATIEQNYVKDNGDDGITLQGSHSNQIKNNTLVNNGAIDYGILLSSSDYNNLTLNNISFENIGIRLESSDNNKISGNTITDTNSECIYFLGSHSNKLLSNIITRPNFDEGVIINNCDDNLISDNTIEDTWMGFFFATSNNNNITSNKFISNSIGFRLASGSNNNIYNNTFIGNNQNANDDGTSNIWDNGTHGNWWDDYTGKDEDKNGVGDTPYNISGSAGSQDRYPIGWFNDTTYLKMFNYSSMEQYSTNQTSEYWRSVVNYTVGYYSAAGLIQDANVSYTWAFGNDNITQDPIKAGGYYTFEFNTSIAQNTGIYTLQITAEHENYSTAMMDFQVNILLRPTTINGTSGVFEVVKRLQAEIPFNFIFEYNDTITGERIGSLDTANYTWQQLNDEGIPVDSGSGNLTEIAENYHLLDFDTETRDNANYTLNITLAKDNYELRTSTTSLEITGYPTDLSPETSIVDAIWNQNFTIRLYYNDTLNALGVNTSQLTYSVIENPSITGVLDEETTDGWYNLTLNTTTLVQLGSYTLNITAKKKFYDEAQVNITVNLGEVPTNLTLSSYSLSIDINDFIILRAYFNDTFSNLGIDNAQLTYYVVENPSISGNFTEEMTEGWYNISLDAVIFSTAGTYTFNITATKNYHSLFSMNVTINVTGTIDHGGNNDNPLNVELIIIFILLGVIGVISATSIYYYRRRSISKSSKKISNKSDSREFLNNNRSVGKFKAFIDNELLLERFNQIENEKDLTPFEDVELTTISNEFLCKLDELDLTDEEKLEILKDSISLSPKEREKILEKILGEQRRTR